MSGRRRGNTNRFARRVRECREEKGWDRKELARRVDVRVATIGNWEGGNGFPQIHTRPILCTELGTDPYDLGLPPDDRDY